MNALSPKSASDSRESESDLPLQRNGSDCSFAYSSFDVGLHCVRRERFRALETDNAFVRSSATYLAIPAIRLLCDFTFRSIPISADSDTRNASLDGNHHLTYLLKGVSPNHMRPKKIILCVDDNEQTLSVRKYLLVTRGYIVHTALNGQEAISIFSSRQIDLVLTDLGLPQMDGNALIGHLKEISPEVPMILTSDTVQAGERAHRADAFLAKGCCTPAGLIEQIRIMSARKRGPRKAAPVKNGAEDAIVSKAS